MGSTCNPAQQNFYLEDMETFYPPGNMLCKDRSSILRSGWLSRMLAPRDPEIGMSSKAPKDTVKTVLFH